MPDNNINGIIIHLVSTISFIDLRILTIFVCKKIEQQFVEMNIKRDLEPRDLALGVHNANSPC